MADFIIIIRPEPDASRDVAWLKRYQVPAIAVPVMQAEKRPFDLSDMAALQAVIFTRIVGEVPGHLGEVFPRQQALVQVADDHLCLVVTANFRRADKDVPGLSLLNPLLASPALI